MKTNSLVLVTLIAGAVLLSASPNRNTSLFTKGQLPVKSINAMAFGPDGVLFLGDSKSAAVFAVKTNDLTASEKSPVIDVPNFDKKIASALGTEPQNITIQEVTVNPISKKIYCAVHTLDGTPVLLRLEDGNLKNVDLKDVEYAVTYLENPIGEEAKDRQGNSKRVWAISDIGFFNGQVNVTGLSNEEFSSTFRSIPYPFNEKQNHSSLEIYHAAHGQYETFAPIKAFAVAEVSGKKQLIASYTCTPLVLFPLDELKPGQKNKGRTVAEMGAGNLPIDMITMKKGNETVLFMANSNRPVFRISLKDIESYQGSLTSPVKEDYGTEGVKFTQFPLVNVLQLDKLDDEQFVLLQRKPNGSLNLWSSTEQWNPRWL